MLKKTLLITLFILTAAFVSGCQSSDTADGNDNYIVTTAVPENAREGVKDETQGYIKINPNLSSAYYRLAFLLYNKGEIAILSAIEQCEKAVELDEKDPDAHTYLGYFLSLNKDFDKAKKEFHKAIKLNPNKARIRLIMAITCLEKIKNSINLSDSIKAIYYGFSGGLLGLFDFLSLKILLKNLNKNIKFLKACIKGKFLEFVDEKKAYNLYLNTVDNSNKSIKMYEKMAKIAIRKFSYDKAFDCFENVRVISKNDPEKIVNAIEFVEKYQNEKTDTLIDYYNLLINHYPKLSRCYFELGNLYLKKEDKLNSLSAFLIALKLEPNNPYYENSVAYSYVQLEKYDMDIEYYNKALIDIKKTPNPEWEAVIYQALASLYHNVKSDSLEAVSSLENALCLTKNTSQVY